MFCGVTFLRDLFGSSKKIFLTRCTSVTQSSVVYTLNGMRFYELRTILQEAFADGVYGVAFLEPQVDVRRRHLVHMEPAVQMVRQMINYFVQSSLLCLINELLGCTTARYPLRSRVAYFSAI